MTDPTVRPQRSLLRPVLWGLASLPILTPLVAMQVTSDVNWTAFDFVFAIALIGSTGLAIEIAVRRTSNAAYRAAAAIAAITALLLLWINAAVGIIGGEAEPANMLYAGVVAVALGGTALSRLRPVGMARTMAAAAAAQITVPVAADLLHPGSIAALAQREVTGLTAVFALLWLASAALFRRSA